MLRLSDFFSCWGGRNCLQLRTAGLTCVLIFPCSLWGHCFPYVKTSWSLVLPQKMVIGIKWDDNVGVLCQIWNHINSVVLLGIKKKKNWEEALKKKNARRRREVLAMITTKEKIVLNKVWEDWHLREGIEWPLNRTSGYDFSGVTKVWMLAPSIFRSMKLTFISVFYQVG